MHVLSSMFSIFSLFVNSELLDHFVRECVKRVGEKEEEEEEEEEEEAVTLRNSVAPLAQSLDAK